MVDAALIDAPARAAPNASPTAAPLSHPYATQERARRAGDAIARARRDQNYDLFKKVAQSLFREPPFDPMHHRMKSAHGYAVVVGGDAGDKTGTDASTDGRTVEIAYGARALTCFETLKDERLRAEWAGATEQGAAMLYVQGDDGVVNLFFHPCRVTGVKGEEDGLHYGRFVDVPAMTGRGLLEKHWRDFRAYAESTRLEGEPTLQQRLRVAWLRFSRPLIKDGRREARRLKAAGESAAKFAAAVVAATALIGVVA